MQEIAIVIVVAFCIAVFCMWGNYEDMKAENRILRAENAEIMYEHEKCGITDKKLDELSDRLEKSGKVHEEFLQTLKERLGVE